LICYFDNGVTFNQLKFLHVVAILHPSPLSSCCSYGAGIAGGNSRALQSGGAPHFATGSRGFTTPVAVTTSHEVAAQVCVQLRRRPAPINRLQW
jgi:hypothetical protein